MTLNSYDKPKWDAILRDQNTPDFWMETSRYVEGGDICAGLNKIPDNDMWFPTEQFNFFGVFNVYQSANEQVIPRFEMKNTLVRNFRAYPIKQKKTTKDGRKSSLVRDDNYG